MNFPLMRKPKTKMVSPDDRMTLTEHLAELRSRIIRALLAVVIGVIVLLALYDQVLNFLRGPYNQRCADNKQGQCELIFIGPLEGLTTRLQICTYGGVVLALPVVLWPGCAGLLPATPQK